jgi:hypothetical protein
MVGGSHALRAGACLRLESQTKLTQDRERLGCPPPALTVFLENSLVLLARQFDPFRHWRCFPVVILRIARTPEGAMTLARTGNAPSAPVRGLASTPDPLGCEPRSAPQTRFQLSHATGSGPQGSALPRWRSVSGAGRERRPLPSRHGVYDRQQGRASPIRCSREAERLRQQPPLEPLRPRDCACPFVVHRFCDRVP